MSMHQEEEQELPPLEEQEQEQEQAAGGGAGVFGEASAAALRGQQPAPLMKPKAFPISCRRLLRHPVDPCLRPPPHCLPLRSPKVK